MKIAKLLLPFLALSATPAFATPLNYTQTFDWLDSHVVLHFTADNTAPTNITALTGGSTVNGNAVTLLVAGDFPILPPFDVPNDNLFDPALLATPGSQGWNFSGISFQDTITSNKYNLYNNSDSQPWMLDGSTTIIYHNAITSNFTTTSVDEPAIFSLFIIGAVAAMVGRGRKHMHA